MTYNVFSGTLNPAHTLDIHSATAEIRRGKKIEDRKKTPQDENIMVCPIP